MKDLPETDDAVAQWCRDAFVAKVNYFIESPVLTFKNCCHFEVHFT